MDTKDLCKWLRDNSSGIYRPAGEAATLIEIQETKITKLQELLKEMCESSCEGCDFLNYRQSAESYECNHPIIGRWLSTNCGSGCKYHTALKILDNESETKEKEM